MALTDRELAKKLYQMELHETVQAPWGIIIMRVPGGWIYDAWDTEKDEFKNGTFVPYNEYLEQIH